MIGVSLPFRSTHTRVVVGCDTAPPATYASVPSPATTASTAPKAVVTKQMHAEWPIGLELDGTYHNLALFFDRVGKFTRIINISGLEVKGKDKPESNSTITATCTATTFVLLDKPAATTAKPGVPPAPGAPKV